MRNCLSENIRRTDRHSDRLRATIDVFVLNFWGHKKQGGRCRTVEKVAVLLKSTPDTTGTEDEVGPNVSELAILSSICWYTNRLPTPTSPPDYRPPSLVEYSNPEAFSFTGGFQFQ